MNLEAASRVEFTVLGEPVPQGSKRVVPTRAGHRAIETNEQRLRPWRTSVADAALEAMKVREDHELGLGRNLVAIYSEYTAAPALTGPLALRATFTFTRPASHYGTGRNAGNLKPTAPTYCPKRPDLDKLLRAIGDALTGIVYRDDAQLVVVQASKRYGTPPSVRIVIEALDDQASFLG